MHVEFLVLEFNKYFFKVNIGLHIFVKKFQIEHL